MCFARGAGQDSRIIWLDSLFLDDLEGLPDLLCDPAELDRRVRFDHAHEVLLEEGVVQEREVGADQWVLLELYGWRVNMAWEERQGSADRCGELH